MDMLLESVFNPRSVAVIGASEVPGKAAERRTRSLLEGGFEGDVFLINPKRSKLFGRKAYPGITDVGKEVDLAMVVIPPRFLVSAVADSVKMGVKGIIIITAGLGETGEDGKKIEAEILNEAAKSVGCAAIRKRTNFRPGSKRQRDRFPDSLCPHARIGF
jgi:acetyltransferase